MIGKTISHYKILEKIGEGGMGVVYKAEDTKLKRTVALKFLPQDLTRDIESKKRFIHEAQAASSLEHNNICNIHEIDETEDGQMFIVMAFYEGQTLKNKIKQGMLRIDRIIDIAIEVAQGLEKAHKQAIVHRDIKSANVIITEEGVAKIVDFGLAKLTGQTKLTKEGSTLGTVAYMSPEQTRGEKVEHSSDIWSLGVVIYEMVTGQLPFKGEYEQAVVYSILSEEPEPVTGLRTGVPVDLERIIDKALAKNPGERYQRTDELLVDLRRLKKGIKREESESREGKKSTTKRKNAIVYILLGLILIIGIGATFRYLVFPYFNKTHSSERKMLVVLPFVNLGHSDDEFFAAGITEEITSRLTSVSRLGVISRTSAEHYTKADRNFKQIGKDLNVEYILRGTVRWAQSPDGSELIRVTPHLIRVSDGIDVWSANYDRILNDIFVIQSDIAQNVVETLGITLLDNERKIVDERPTENLEAYQAYLRGRYNAGRPHFTLENWKQVIRSYQRAVELDPDFALAYAELAKAHARLYFFRHDLSKERLEMARRAAERAIELDPTAPKVHIALGYYYLYAYRDYEKALKMWNIADKSMPNHVAIMKAKMAVFELQGRWDEFIDMGERAIELSPKDASLLIDIVIAFWLNRKYSKALEVCDKAIVLAPDEPWCYLYKAFVNWSWKGVSKESRGVLESMPPDHSWAPWAWFWQEVGEGRYREAFEHVSSSPGDWIRLKMWAMPKELFLAYMHEFLGDNRSAQAAYESAKTLLEVEVQKWPDDPRLHSSLGIAYAGLGHRDEAIKEGKRAVELLPISKDAVYGLPYLEGLAVIYTMLEEYDAAFDQVEHLMSIPSWFSISWFKIDRRYAKLLTQERFKTLQEKFSGED